MDRSTEISHEKDAVRSRRDKNHEKKNNSKKPMRNLNITIMTTLITTNKSQKQ